MIPIRQLNTSISSPNFSQPILVGRDSETKEPIFIQNDEREVIQGSFHRMDVDASQNPGTKQDSFRVEGRLTAIPDWLIHGGTYDIRWRIPDRGIDGTLYVDAIGESVLGLDKTFGHFIGGIVKLSTKA